MTKPTDQTGQEPAGQEATPASGQAPDATSEPGQAPAVAPDVEGLAARLAKLEADNAKLRGEAADRRVAAKDAEAATLAELEQKGELQKLNEALKTKLATAESNEADALSWRGYMERETERLNAKAEGLPEWQRQTFDALPSLEARANFLSNVTKEPPAPEPNAPLANAAAVPANQRRASDLSATEIRDLGRNNPAELARLYREQNPNQGNGGSSLMGMLQKLKT